jgi:hypothetical protein
MIPWLMAALMYVFFFSFSAVSGSDPLNRETARFAAGGTCCLFTASGFVDITSAPAFPMSRH